MLAGLVMILELVYRALCKRDAGNLHPAEVVGGTIFEFLIRFDPFANQNGVGRND